MNSSAFQQQKHDKCHTAHNNLLTIVRYKKALGLSQHSMLVKNTCIAFKSLIKNKLTNKAHL